MSLATRLRRGVLRTAGGRNIRRSQEFEDPLYSASRLQGSEDPRYAASPESPSEARGEK